MKDEETTKAKSAQYAPSAAETVRALWAKTDLESMTDRTHPLVCHMIDTAAVGALAWHRVFSDTNREAIAADLGVSVEVARAWAIFLAATHDLGKACLGFQIGRLCARGRISRDEEVVTVEESLRSAGLTIPDRQISPSAPATSTKNDSESTNPATPTMSSRKPREDPSRRAAPIRFDFCEGLGYVLN